MTPFALRIGPVHSSLKCNSLLAVEAFALKDCFQSVEIDVSERL